MKDYEMVKVQLEEARKKRVTQYRQKTPTKLHTPRRSIPSPLPPLPLDVVSRGPSSSERMEVDSPEVRRRVGLADGMEDHQDEDYPQFLATVARDDLLPEYIMNIQQVARDEPQVAEEDEQHPDRDRLEVLYAHLRDELELMNDDQEDVGAPVVDNVIDDAIKSSSELEEEFSRQKELWTAWETAVVKVRLNELKFPKSGA